MDDYRREQYELNPDYRNLPKEEKDRLKKHHRRLIKSAIKDGDIEDSDRIDKALISTKKINSTTNLEIDK